MSLAFFHRIAVIVALAIMVLLPPRAVRADVWTDTFLTSSNEFCRAKLTVCKGRANEPWFPGFRVTPDLSLLTYFADRTGQLDLSSLREAMLRDPALSIKVAIRRGWWALDLRYHGSLTVQVDETSRWRLRSTSRSVAIDGAFSVGFSLFNSVHVGYYWAHFDRASFETKDGNFWGGGFVLGLQVANPLLQLARQAP